MDLNLNKHHPLSLLIFFLSASSFLIIFQGSKGKRCNTVVESSMAIFSPLQELTINIARGTRYVWSDYIALVNIRQENRELKNKIEILKNINNQYIEAVQANKRLRKLLAFQKKISELTISSEIIGKDSTNWCQNILLDKGSQEGISVNMPVVTYNGVVGKIHEVTNHTAKVLLINDINSSVAVLIQRNRAEGILVGKAKSYCTIKYLRRDVEVKKGDRVITSGMGGVFPKGLIVGTVSKIHKNNYGLFQYAEVIPEANISKLEEVFIIKRTPAFSLNEK